MLFEEITFGAIDTETTGLLDTDHRFVEVHISLWKNSKKIHEYETLIDPRRSIGAEAQRVHGISISDLVGKPQWEVVGPEFAKIMAQSDMYVWQNGNDFDGPFIRQEMKRIGLVMPERIAIDTMQEGLWATHDGKKPRLEELCFACGVPYDPAKSHGAGYDVEVMMQCFFRARELGYFALPELAGTLLSAA